MGKPRTDPLLTVHFKCGGCNHDFNMPPDRIEDAPDRPWHPFMYFKDCPRCEAEIEQSGREQGLLKAWANATGPRTPEGIAAVTKNIEGHPTPEESQQTRFNALKHGIYAKTATYFPAKPGRYAICESCHYRDNECNDTDDSTSACLRRVELFMRNQMAFEAKDPSVLMENQAARQAAIQSLIDEMIITIAADGGPRIKCVEWYYDKDGCFHLAKYTDKETGEEVQIYKLEEHPSMKRLMDYIAKNNMTLADMGMTPKVQEDQEILRGHLADDTEAEKESSQQYMAQLEKQNDVLLGLISNSYENAPAIEYEKVIDG